MQAVLDFIKSLLDVSRERLKNPIVSAFIFSWLAINWRIVLILVYSDLPMIERIGHVEEHYLSLDTGLIYPVAAALFYALGIPYIMTGLDWANSWGMKKRREVARQFKYDELKAQQIIAVEEKQLERIRNEGTSSLELASKLDLLELRFDEIEQFMHAEKDQSTELDAGKNQSLLTDSVDKVNMQPSRTASDGIHDATIKGDKVVNHYYNTFESSKENLKKEYLIPSLKQLDIKDLPKTEEEWLLVYAQYNTERGVITNLDSLVELEYDESGQQSMDALEKGEMDEIKEEFEADINRLVKSGYLRYINETDLELTANGLKLVKEILAR